MSTYKEYQNTHFNEKEGQSLKIPPQLKQSPEFKQSPL